MKRFLIITAVVGTAGLIAALAGAQMHRPDGSEHGLRSALEKIGATNEQMREIHALHEQTRAETEPLHKKMHAFQEEMKKLWLEEPLSEAKIIKLHRKIHALHGKLAEYRIETHIDLLEILTPKQRSGFVKMGHPFPRPPHHGEPAPAPR